MPTPEGFSTVNSYIVVSDAKNYIDFLVQAMGAKEIGRTVMDDRIANCRLWMGESIVMVGESNDKNKPTYGLFYWYVDDADAAYAQAIENGAESVLEPQDMPYGDRQGIFKDPEGNLWCPSTRFDDAKFNG